MAFMALICGTAAIVGLPDSNDHAPCEKDPYQVWLGASSQHASTDPTFEDPLHGQSQKEAKHFSGYKHVMTPL